jgi:hypothetical protein
LKRLSIIVLLELAFVCGAGAQGNTYTTNFPVTEDPISESGRWISAHAIGLDWADVRTTPGLAHGTNSYSALTGYNDSTAVLTGTWGPNQTVQATVHTTNQQTGSIYEEVEIRLRTTITAHSLTGYEINFRCNHDGSQYIGIVRWNGPLSDFTQLGSNVAGPGLVEGSVVKGTIVGSTITAYVDGVAITSQTDSTYTAGSPGMGFWLQGLPVSNNSDFGFTSFSASDGSARPLAPTNLRIGVN